MNTARPEAATKQPPDLGSASIRMTRVSGVTGTQAVPVRCDSILIRTEEGRRTTGNTERLSWGVALKRTPGHPLTYRHRADPDANQMARSVHAVVLRPSSVRIKIAAYGTILGWWGLAE